MSDPALTNYPQVSQIPVAWGEMDALQHVNNVVYFRYFEIARLAYFDKVDMMQTMKQTQCGPILASTQCQYKAPVTYPDTVQVGARTVNLGEYDLHMEYAVWSEKLQRIAAVGTARVVYYDFKKHQKTPLVNKLIDNIHRLEGDRLDTLTTE